MQNSKLQSEPPVRFPSTIVAEVIATTAAVISLFFILDGVVDFNKTTFLGGSTCFLLALILLAVCQVVKAIKAASKKNSEYFQKK